MSQQTFQAYVPELSEFDLRDVKDALRLIGIEPRGEYETTFPALGTIIGRVKEVQREREKPKPFVPCGECHNGLVVFEKDGYRFAESCQCKKDWKAAHQANVAG